MYVTLTMQSDLNKVSEGKEKKQTESLGESGDLER